MQRRHVQATRAVLEGSSCKGQRWIRGQSAGSARAERFARSVPDRRANESDSRLFTDNETSRPTKIALLSGSVPAAFQAGHAGSTVIHAHVSRLVTEFSGVRFSCAALSADRTLREPYTCHASGRCPRAAHGRPAFSLLANCPRLQQTMLVGGKILARIEEIRRSDSGLTPDLLGSAYRPYARSQPTSVFIACALRQALRCGRAPAPGHACHRYPGSAPGADCH